MFGCAWPPGGALGPSRSQAALQSEPAGGTLARGVRRWVFNMVRRLLQGPSRCPRSATELRLRGGWGLWYSLAWKVTPGSLTPSPRFLPGLQASLKGEAPGFPEEKFSQRKSLTRLLASGSGVWMPPGERKAGEAPLPPRWAPKVRVSPQRAACAVALAPLPGSLPPAQPASQWREAQSRGKHMG